jgi:GR25 family glycosyltransferase involved in LPS biosynthesis
MLGHSLIHRALGLCAIAGYLGGCAIHPLPEDTARFDTNAIVLHIRCEARSALQHETTAFLLDPRTPIPDSTRQLARDLADGTIKFEDFDPKKLDRTSRFYLLKYENSAIAYDFTFDMAEDNAIGANLSFLSTMTSGATGFALGAGSDRQRQTIRNFRVSDTFGELRAMRECAYPYKGDKNYVYPVTGSIGLDEMVRTFVELNEANRLAAPGNSKVPVMADTFSFLTTISVGATPLVTLAPASAAVGFAVLPVPNSLGVSRRDTHKVVIAMSLPPTESEPVRPRSGGGILSVGPVMNKSARSAAEQRALTEIDNQKTINSLNNILVK